MQSKNLLLTFFASVFALFVLIPTASAARAKSSATALLRAVNSARAAHGLRPLRTDATLARAAQAHSQDMLAHGYFAHGAFASRLASFGARGLIGENLAWESGNRGSAQAFVEMWLASPPHRANLLRPDFTRIGFGISRGTFQGYPGATLVTADFGGR
jgi:uncharacterized protein YkwD